MTSRASPLCLTDISMKITLFTINASYVHSSAALRCLTPPLMRAGFEVSAVERTLQDRRRDVLYALVSENADVYGFSAAIWNIRELSEPGTELKLLTGKPIILGGPEMTGADGETAAKYSFADCIIDGEGEITLPRVCRMFEAGVTPPKILRGEDASAVFLTAGHGYTESDAAEPKLIGYESSRGCPYRCRYCVSSLDRRVFAKPAEQVIAECDDLERIFANSDRQRTVKFLDRTFNFDPRRALEIWRRLAEGDRHLSYHFEVCAELLDDKTLDFLASVPEGRFRFEIGVQSTNPKTLEAVDRPTDMPKLTATLADLRRASGISVHADLIAGLPHEGYERFAESFDKVYSLCDVIQVGFLKLLPGTPLRRDAENGSFPCVFSPNPPYEVLSTPDLSYEELRRLHGVSDACERFGSFGRSGSGGFTRSLGYITSRIPSPFALFERLAQQGGEMRFSQPEAYRLLARVGSEFLDTDMHAEFLSYMRLDWLLSETAYCPDFLCPEQITDRSSLRRIFAELEEIAPDIHRHSCEAHRFAFDRGHIHVVDRRNRRFYALPNE